MFIHCNFPWQFRQKQNQFHKETPNKNPPKTRKKRVYSRNGDTTNTLKYLLRAWTNLPWCDSQWLHLARLFPNRIWASLRSFGVLRTIQVTLHFETNALRSCADLYLQSSSLRLGAYRMDLPHSVLSHVGYNWLFIEWILGDIFGSCLHSNFYAIFLGNNHWPSFRQNLQDF